MAARAHVVVLLSCVLQASAVLYALGGFKTVAPGVGFSSTVAYACGNTASLGRLTTAGYSLPLSNAYFGSAVFKSQVVVAGGLGAAGTPLDAVWTYSCQGWLQLPRLQVPRFGLRLAAVGDALYAIGGSNGVTSLSVVERYTEASGWTTVGSLQTPRAHFGVAVLGSKIFAVGGDPDVNSTVIAAVSETNSTCLGLSSVEAYDTQAPGAVWQDAPPMTFERCRHAVTAMDGSIYALGGLQRNGTAVNSVERFNGSSWSSFSDIPGYNGNPAGSPTGSVDAALLGVDGTLYYLGGLARSPFWTTNSDAYLWTPTFLSWTRQSPAPQWTSRGSAFLSHNWDCTEMGWECGLCAVPDACGADVTCGLYGGLCNTTNDVGRFFCTLGHCMAPTTGTTGSTGSSGTTGSSGSSGTSGTTGTTSTGTTGTTSTGTSGTTGTTGVPINDQLVGPSPSDNSGAVIGGAVGGSVGGAALLVVVVVLVLLYRRSKKTALSMQNSSGTGALIKAEHMATPTSWGSLDVSLWEIDYATLDIQDRLGAGAFGVASLAKWRGTQCVVKTTQVDDKVARDAFVKELTAMKNLRPHPNVVLLLGVCINPAYPLALVLEYVDGGSLDSLLNDPGAEVDSEMALRLSMDIAAGMRHLHAESILHCDLSARNVLISKRGESYVAKIADFGLSHATNTDGDVYSSATTLKLPIRWTAPEILEDPTQHTKAGDIWSFGVVIWEILERDRPYPNLVTNQQVIAYLMRGEVLHRPTRINYHPVLDEVMALCFKRDAPARPSFEELLNMLTEAEHSGFYVGAAKYASSDSSSDSSDAEVVVRDDPVPYSVDELPAASLAGSDGYGVPRDGVLSDSTPYEEGQLRRDAPTGKTPPGPAAAAYLQTPADIADQDDTELYRASPVRLDSPKPSQPSSPSSSRPVTRVASVRKQKKKEKKKATRMQKVKSSIPDASTYYVSGPPTAVGTPLSGSTDVELQPPTSAFAVEHPYISSPPRSDGLYPSALSPAVESIYSVTPAAAGRASSLGSPSDSFSTLPSTSAGPSSAEDYNVTPSTAGGHTSVWSAKSGAYADPAPGSGTYALPQPAARRS